MASACVTRLMQVVLAFSIALGMPLHIAAAALWSVVLLFVSKSPSKPPRSPLESSAPSKKGSCSGSSNRDHCTIEVGGPLTFPVGADGGKLPAL